MVYSTFTESRNSVASNSTFIETLENRHHLFGIVKKSKKTTLMTFKLFFIFYLASFANGNNERPKEDLANYYTPSRIEWNRKKCFPGSDSKIFVVSLMFTITDCLNQHLRQKGVTIDTHLSRLIGSMNQVYLEQTATAFTYEYEVLNRGEHTEMNFLDCYTCHTNETHDYFWKYRAKTKKHMKKTYSILYLHCTNETHYNYGLASYGIDNYNSAAVIKTVDEKYNKITFLHEMGHGFNAVHVYAKDFLMYPVTHTSKLFHLNSTKSICNTIRTFANKPLPQSSVYFQNYKFRSLEKEKNYENVKRKDNPETTRILKTTLDATPTQKPTQNSVKDKNKKRILQKTKPETKKPRKKSIYTIVYERSLVEYNYPKIVSYDKKGYPRDKHGILVYPCEFHARKRFPRTADGYPLFPKTKTNQIAFFVRQMCKPKHSAFTQFLQGEKGEIIVDLSEEQFEISNEEDFPADFTRGEIIFLTCANSLAFLALVTLLRVYSEKV